jgi:DNA-directed RNA polymerase II subunit RPB1
MICATTGVSLSRPPISNPRITGYAARQRLIDFANFEGGLNKLMIRGSRISLYAPDQLERIGSDIRIISRIVGNNVEGTINDPKMGIISIKDPCPKCDIVNCPGHFGYLPFPKNSPIYNPGTIGEIISILQIFCNCCGKLLIHRDVILDRGYLNLPFDKRLKALEIHATGMACICENPPLDGGSISRCTPNFKIDTGDMKKIKAAGIIYQEMPKDSKDSKTSTSINPQQVYDILNHISNEDAEFIGMSRDNHPRNLMMPGILVPPQHARPPEIVKGVEHQEMITTAYINLSTKVLSANTNNLRQIASSTKKPRKVRRQEPESKYEDYSIIYDMVHKLLYKVRDTRIGGKPMVSIVERLQGKDALIRGMLMGKRVDYCARTVAGPDPSLKFGELSIPMFWDKEITKRVSVNATNIDYLKELAQRGRITNVWVKSTREYKRWSVDMNYVLKIGDVVNRWLETGDRIFVNRQPTLHKVSMMGYHVVLKDQHTIGLHLSYTTPMNCDFDGDENNLWNPRDFEVEAEVEYLINVKQNIMSPEQNKPTMGLVMNAVTTFYLWSMGVIISDDLFQELISMVTNRSDVDTLSYRLKKYGVHPRSGNAIISAMLPADFCYTRGDVRVREGILISGLIKKGNVGTSHRSIIQELHKKYGIERTCDFFTDAPRIANKWLMESGFTIGIADCVMWGEDEKTGERINKAEVVVRKELASIYVKLDALGGKQKDHTDEMYRTRQINALVADAAKNLGIQLASKTLTKDNAISVMTERGAGTKGSVANIGQMIACVGQQFLAGEVLASPLTGGRRRLPTQDLDDNNPQAHGFVSNSFYQGLTPEELFDIQSGGRENLLDTAMKTQDTGFLQHSMVKAFEGVIIANDGSVRNTVGVLFSTIYNNGYDPAAMLSVGDNGFTSFIDIDAVITEINMDAGWVTEDVAKVIINNRANLTESLSDSFVEDILPYNVPESRSLDTSIVTFPTEMVTKYEKTRIISTRAMQLADNAQPKVPLTGALQGILDPVTIAGAEYDAGLIDIYSVRSHFDGTVVVVHNH